jgi:MtN3 and saliva related transmembrane protein
MIGLTAAFLTTISFVPQAVRIIKSRHTKDISLTMYAVLTTGIFLWLIYGIALDSWPIILANGTTLVLTLIILILKMKYK